jgi:hypothetical protein
MMRCQNTQQGGAGEETRLGMTAPCRARLIGSHNVGLRRSSPMAVKRMLLTEIQLPIFRGDLCFKTLGSSFRHSVSSVTVKPLQQGWTQPRWKLGLGNFKQAFVRMKSNFAP